MGRGVLDESEHSKPKVRPVWQMLHEYFSELVASFAVLVTIFVSSLYCMELSDCVEVTCALFMVIGIVIMFNTAMTRVATAEILEELQKGGNDGEQ